MYIGLIIGEASERIPNVFSVISKCPLTDEHAGPVVATLRRLNCGNSSLAPSLCASRILPDEHFNPLEPMG
jgi:hypothetical protein